jgi:hypothetical protein
MPPVPRASRPTSSREVYLRRNLGIVVSVPGESLGGTRIGGSLPAAELRRRRVMSLFYARIIQAIQRHRPSILHEEGGGVDWAGGIGRRRGTWSLRKILGRDGFRGTADSSASNRKPGVCHPHADGFGRGRRAGDHAAATSPSRERRSCRRRTPHNGRGGGGRRTRRERRERSRSSWAVGEFVRCFRRPGTGGF